MSMCPQMKIKIPIIMLLGGDGEVQCCIGDPLLCKWFLMLLETLQRFSYKYIFVSTEIHTCQRRKHDGFKKIIEEIMQDIEDSMLQCPCKYDEFEISLKNFDTCTWCGTLPTTFQFMTLAGLRLTHKPLNAEEEKRIAHFSDESVRDF